jgi:hypothetical protein
LPNARANRVYLLDSDTSTATEWPRGLAAMTAAGRVPALPLAPGCFIHLYPPNPLAMYYNTGDAAKGEPLGERTIAGLKAIGSRFTTTLPRGAYASETPIQMTEERWVSPELRVVVASRHQDTKIGIVEYQLTHIDRREPAPELFEVPNGWPVAPATGIGARFANPYVASGCQPARPGRQP